MVKLLGQKLDRFEKSGGDKCDMEKNISKKV